MLFHYLSGRGAINTRAAWLGLCGRGSTCIVAVSSKTTHNSSSDLDACISGFKDEPVNQTRGLGNYRPSPFSLFQAAVKYMRSIL